MAELEIYHSRPIAPTRRISIGNRNLPVVPSPGLGGLLLAGIVAQFAPSVSPEFREDLWDFFVSLDEGAQITQPQVRHRFQEDRVGLSLSSQILHSDGSFFEFDFASDLARPVQLVLGALYATATLPRAAQTSVLGVMHMAFTWEKKVDQLFVDAVFSGKGGAQQSGKMKGWSDPVDWALEILEISQPAEEGLPSRRAIQKQFRYLLRLAHPDQGGGGTSAGDRITDLADARSILLSKLS